MSSVPRMRSAWPLVVAHDLDEPFLERLAAAAQLVERYATADEPARGVALYELRCRRKTLEEWFVEVMGEDQRPG